ncbi:MAG: CotH kinase family protein [Muribaculaceae bacterium]|nr:CotH kinase family protein [Muribaculaceae bacterium]
MKKFLLLSIALIAGIFCLKAQQPLYVCGGFNGWDPKNPAEFVYADGLYILTIDFSQSKEFKISTVKGVSGDGWADFDKGTYAVEGDIEMHKWINLYALQKAPNITAPTAETIKVFVDLGAGLINFGGEGEYPTKWSGTLPVLFINTENNAPVVEKEKYLNATYYLDPMGLEGVQAIGSAETPLSTQIKGRGNYSWTGFEKKPYRLKLADKQPLMGMPKSKHFVLLAHADDSDGFLRNETGFTISRLLEMPWTPESYPVELVLNGDYRGLYFLTQNIRVDSDRVDIIEQEDNATQDVDGGWLVEIDNYDTDPHITVYEDGSSQQPIWFTYKSPEELSEAQKDYLQSAMQMIDNAVYAPQTQSATPELANLVDLNILARYYITQEICDDGESFHGSCYLYRDRGADCKWKFGPVWDFGNSFNRRRTDLFIWQNPPFHQVWIGQMYKFEAFRSEISKVWEWYLSFGPAQLKEHLADYVDKIYVAAIYDSKRWPEYGNADILKDLTRIQNLIDEKTEWLKSKWGDASIEQIEATDACNDGPMDIYNLQGVQVLKSASKEQIDALPAGLYITPRGKVLIK